jgi:hypothetical protein
VNPHIRAGARIDGSYEQPRKHGAVSSARCSDPRKIMSRPSCRVKAPLGRREHTIAPDLVTGHLDGVREEFPCRLNCATPTPSPNLSVAAAAAETVLPPWMRAAFLYTLVLARWVLVLN